MVARKTGSLTPSDFLAAAVAFVSTNGLEAMTMRALGESMGVDATALYRHYPSKDSLIEAMIEWFMGEIVARVDTGISDPRERVINTVLAAREMFRAHPEIGASITRSELGGGEPGRALMITFVDALRELGLEGQRLVHSYQMIEGFVIGACTQDFGLSPRNFSIRRVRYRSLDVREFDEVAVSEQGIADLADAAFLGGVNAILDASLAGKY